MSPALKRDRGDVIFHSFNMETGVVEVELLGACKGCSRAKETMKNRIEKLLKYYVPEVK